MDTTTANTTETEAAVRVHAPIADIAAFVAEMERFDVYYYAGLKNGEVAVIYRSEPAEPRDNDAINALLRRLRATENWKARLGEFCVATGRTYPIN